MNERGIPQDYAIQTFKNPDKSYPNNNGFKYIKHIENKKITLLIIKNDQYEWVAISIWMDPPMEGTNDYKKQRRYQEYKKASFGKKIWMSILKQLGI